MPGGFVIFTAIANGSHSGGYLSPASRYMIDSSCFYMKKTLFLFLLVLLGVAFCACNSDDGEQTPFVTDVEMPSEAEVFAPGDEVVVKARGFEADDDIMLCITWPLSLKEVAEGSADGVWAVVTGRTESSITFLAPGGYPAGTTEVKLFRRGRAVPLGKIAVSDGLPPEEYSLYGITNYDSDETSIDRIDMATGDVTRITTLGVGQGVRCAVNDPGTNRIYCVTSDENYGSAAFYDLTMRYYRNSGFGGVVTAGVTTGQDVAFFRYVDERFLMMNLGAVTRTSPVPSVYWQLPDGMKPEMFSEYPFVMVTGGYFLLSAHNADGDYVPVVFDARSANRVAMAGDAVRADAMMPFRILVSKEGQAEPVYSMVGGYAVAKDGVTELRLFDPATGTFGETLAEIPAAVSSLAVHVADVDRQTVYMLCGAEGAEKHLRTWEVKSGAQHTLPGTVYCSEIVLAR